MSLAVNLERYRRTKVRQLEQKKKKVQADLLKLQAELQKIETQLAYARLPAQSGEDCPRCLCETGVSVHLTPIPSENPKLDLFRCERCGYDTDQPA